MAGLKASCLVCFGSLASWLWGWIFAYQLLFVLCAVGGEKYACVVSDAARPKLQAALEVPIFQLLKLHGANVHMVHNGSGMGTEHYFSCMPSDLEGSSLSETKA